MKKNILIGALVLSTLLTLSNKTNAQNVFVNEEPQITELLNNFIRWNQEKDYITGWRIQIINTDNRREMERAMDRFRQLYPYITNVSWEQINPYYKVKVGGFNSKLKAQAFLNEVQQNFPSAITVWEKIGESEFIDIYE